MIVEALGIIVHEIVETHLKVWDSSGALDCVDTGDLVPKLLSSAVVVVEESASLGDHAFADREHDERLGLGIELVSLRVEALVVLRTKLKALEERIIASDVGEDLPFPTEIVGGLDQLRGTEHVVLGGHGGKIDKSRELLEASVLRGSAFRSG